MNSIKMDVRLKKSASSFCVSLMLTILVSLTSCEVSHFKPPNSKGGENTGDGPVTSTDISENFKP
jgi:hypothetical protein